MDDVLTMDKILAAKKLLEDTAPVPRWDGTIRENALLTVSKSRVRSWRERLLTWPWRPWRRCFIWSEPDPNIYKVPYDGISVLTPMRSPQREMWFAHPATAQQIRQALHSAGDGK